MGRTVCSAVLLPPASQGGLGWVPLASIFFHSPLQRLYALDQFFHQLFHNIMFLYTNYGSYAPIILFSLNVNRYLITTLTSSSLFTLGIAHASMALLSLNHNLFTVHDIDTLLGLLNATTHEVVDEL